MKQVKLTIVILFLFTGMLFCTILKVPQDYSTIQSAINAVKNHDTVLVSEGIYYENINYNGKNIVVASNFIFTKDFETIQNTIIDGSTPHNPDSASVVMIVSGEDSSAVLEGFTIRKGTGTLALNNAWIEGGGILIENSSKPVIKHNIITDNKTVFRKTASNGGGGGISTIRSCPTIINNIIISNEAGYAGGIVFNWSGGIVRNNIFYNNLATSQYGTGGVMIWDKAAMEPQICENNTIVGNFSQAITGGLSIDRSATPICRNNIIWFNRQGNGKQVVKPQAGKYNNIEDNSDNNNISADPQFLENSFMLSDNSPCIDAGDTSMTSNDNVDPENSAKALSPSKGGQRNDIGAFGGPFASILPQVNLLKYYVSKTDINYGKFDISMNATRKIEILNLSTRKLIIDSVVHTDRNNFTISNIAKTLNSFQSDSLEVTFVPASDGIKHDTIKIFFQPMEQVKPIIIIVRGEFTDVKEYDSRVNQYELFQNYPNPFNPETIIKFSLQESGPVTLKVYNILGKEIETLISKDMNAGVYSINWRPTNYISSGVYLFKLTAGSFSEVKKMLYQK